MPIRPEDRPDRPIAVVAEGDAEVAQLLRRMTADAWQVAGGVILALGREVWPLFWVAPDGAAALTAFSRFHQDAAGQPLPDFVTRTAWDTSGPETAAGPRLARLTIWARHPDGREQSFSLWWDAIHHQVLLDQVVRTRRLLVLAAKPTPAMLGDPLAHPWPLGVVVTFDEALRELPALLARAAPEPR
jgi:hypothetical protein